MVLPDFPAQSRESRAFRFCQSCKVTPITDCGHALGSPDHRDSNKGVLRQERLLPLGCFPASSGSKEASTRSTKRPRDSTEAEPCSLVDVFFSLPPSRLYDTLTCRRRGSFRYGALDRMLNTPRVHHIFQEIPLHRIETTTRKG